MIILGILIGLIVYVFLNSYQLVTKVINNGILQVKRYIIIYIHW